MEQREVVAPPADDDALRGWTVGEIDHSFIITFTDGRPPVVGTESVARWVAANTEREIVMPLSEANYSDEAATDATGLLDYYVNPAVTFIGQYKTSAAEVMQVKRPWSDLARSNTLGRVTLDVEPEMHGRPQPGRPGVDQIVFVALPSWHPMFKAGHQEVVALLYRPVTTYLADQIVGGHVVKVERASSFDLTGWIGIVRYFGGLDEAEQERTDLWQALKDFSKSTYGDDSEPEEDVDPAAGKYGSKEAWGV